jgi:hypothetical protein
MRCATCGVPMLGQTYAEVTPRCEVCAPPRPPHVVSELQMRIQASLAFVVLLPPLVGWLLVTTYHVDARPSGAASELVRMALVGGAISGIPGILASVVLVATLPRNRAFYGVVAALPIVLAAAAEIFLLRVLLHLFAYVATGAASW